jgi:hypothetical protein
MIHPKNNESKNTIYRTVCNAHTAQIESGVEEWIYEPIVQNSDFTRRIKLTKKTKGWLDESKIVFDQLEPGLNRSMEPKRTYVPPLIFRFDTKGNKTSRNGIVDCNNNNITKIVVVLLSKIIYVTTTVHS